MANQVVLLWYEYTILHFNVFCFETNPDRVYILRCLLLCPTLLLPPSGQVLVSDLLTKTFHISVSQTL